MINFKINSKKKIKLKISDSVFVPTSTTDILIKSSSKIIKKKSKILDLGCGSGVVGISLSKLGKTLPKVYFSDISNNAIQDVKFNAKLNNVDYVVKKGSLLNPWKNIKFDFIINDVAAISEKIADISNWYKNVSCISGVDGTKLVNKIINSSKKYLNKNGALFIPIISLSNEKKIINVAKKNYRKVVLIDYLDWPLPQEMYKHKKIIYDLKNKQKINFDEKWGMIICRTSVYMLK